MQFKNTTGEEKLIRRDLPNGRSHFERVMPGQVVNIPKYTGDYLGFSQVREGAEIKSEDEAPDKKRPAKKEEPKKEEKGGSDKYRQRLLDIDGVGPKTMRDVVAEYPGEEELKLALIDGEHLPFHDHIKGILEKEFLG